MREEVRRYLCDRIPSALAASQRLFVTGPTYKPVGVTALLVPSDASQAGAIETAARAAIEQFLHPLYGGPDGKGWDFGRAVFRSDLAVVLGSIDGLDHVESLGLTVNGQLTGESASVPAAQIVVAGPIELKLKAS